MRAIDVFIDELDLKGLGFEGMQPELTGRPAYHPASLLINTTLLYATFFSASPSLMPSASAIPLP